MGVVRLNSTDSSKGNSSPAQIIAASPTALATATQVGVDGVCIKNLCLSSLISFILYGLIKEIADEIDLKNETA